MAFPASSALGGAALHVENLETRTVFRQLEQCRIRDSVALHVQMLQHGTGTSDAGHALVAHMQRPVEVEVEQVRAVEAMKRLWHQPERVEIDVL